jgi:hypothetical protein
LKSLACGVGNILTAVCRFGPPSPYVPAPFDAVACGVGHRDRLTARPSSLPLGPALLLFGTHIPCGVGQCFTKRSSDTLLFVSKFKASLLVHFRSMWSLAVGVGMLWVGDDPNPVAPVRGTNGGSRYAFVAIYINSDNFGIIS